MCLPEPLVISDANSVDILWIDVDSLTPNVSLSPFSDTFVLFTMLKNNKL